MCSKLLLSTLLPLPACMTKALWTANDTMVTLEQQDRAEFAVEAIGVAEEARTDPTGESAPPGLVVQARRTGGHEQDGSGQAQPCWFWLQPGKAGEALALAELLTAEPLGPIDRCAIELEWTLSHGREQFWAARIELRGEFSPRLRHCVLGESDAQSLLASDVARSVHDLAAPELPHCVDAAEHLDWRVLLPWETDGSGRVLACVLRESWCGDAAAAGIDAIDLLVRVDAGTAHRYLRVPAALTPVLAAVARDPTTLFDRFVLRTRCNTTRPVLAPSVPMRSLQHPASLALTTNVQELHDRVSLLEKIVLTPFTVGGDTAVWFLRHGPFQNLVVRMAGVGEQASMRPAAVPGYSH